MDKPARPSFRWMRPLGISFGVLAGMILIPIVVTNGLVYFRLNRTYDIPPSGIVIISDPGTVARGAHLVTVLAGCTDCHGADLSGRFLFDSPLLGQIAASNLTAGPGGIGAAYDDEDWIRAIRHGVGPDRRPLIFVMSSFYANLSDEDTAAMVAYLKSIPSVKNELPPTRVGLLNRWWILFNPDSLPAQVIDHNRGPVSAPERGETAEYGAYLSIACQVCHGPNLEGGVSIGAGGVNLTPSGELGEWTEKDFLRAIRTGMLPGFYYQLDDTMMPWRRLRQLEPEELTAIWLYLQTLPDSPSQ